MTIIQFQKKSYSQNLRLVTKDDVVIVEIPHIHAKGHGGIDKGFGGLDT